MALRPLAVLGPMRVVVGHFSQFRQLQRVAQSTAFFCLPYQLVGRDVRTGLQLFIQNSVQIHSIMIMSDAILKHRRLVEFESMLGSQISFYIQYKYLICFLITIPNLRYKYEQVKIMKIHKIFKIFMNIRKNHEILQIS